MVLALSTPLALTPSPVVLLEAAPDETDSLDAVIAELPRPLSACLIVLTHGAAAPLARRLRRRHPDIAWDLPTTVAELPMGRGVVVGIDQMPMLVAGRLVMRPGHVTADMHRHGAVLIQSLALVAGQPVAAVLLNPRVPRAASVGALRRSGGMVIDLCELAGAAPAPALLGAALARWLTLHPQDDEPAMLGPDDPPPTVQGASVTDTTAEALAALAARLMPMTPAGLHLVLDANHACKLISGYCPTLLHRLPHPTEAEGLRFVRGHARTLLRVTLGLAERLNGPVTQIGPAEAKDGGLAHAQVLAAPVLQAGRTLYLASIQPLRMAASRPQRGGLSLHCVLDGLFAENRALRRNLHAEGHARAASGRARDLMAGRLTRLSDAVTAMQSAEAQAENAAKDPDATEVLGIALFTLDHDLRIQSFNPEAGLILGLLAHDRGRPLGHLTLNIDDPALAQDVTAAIAGQRVIERDVSGPSGRWLARRISPRRDTAGEVCGVQVACIDITRRRAALEALIHAGTETRASAEALRRAAAASAGQVLHGAQRLYLLTAQIEAEANPEARAALLACAAQTLDAMGQSALIPLGFGADDHAGMEPQPTAVALDPLLTDLAGWLRPMAQAGGFTVRRVRSGLIGASLPRVLAAVVRLILATVIGDGPGGRLLLGCRPRDDRLTLEMHLAPPPHPASACDPTKAQMLALASRIAANARPVCDWLHHPLTLKTSPTGGLVIALTLTRLPDRSAPGQHRPEVGHKALNQDHATAEHLGASVLVVEADACTRALYSRGLGDMGWRVQAAEGLVEALHLIGPQHAQECQNDASPSPKTDANAGLPRHADIVLLGQLVGGQTEAEALLAHPRLAGPLAAGAVRPMRALVLDPGLDPGRLGPLAQRPPGADGPASLDRIDKGLADLLAVPQDPGSLGTANGHAAPPLPTGTVVHVVSDAVAFRRRLVRALRAHLSGTGCTIAEQTLKDALAGGLTGTLPVTAGAKANGAASAAPAQAENGAITCGPQVLLIDATSPPTEAMRALIATCRAPALVLIDPGTEVAMPFGGARHFLPLPVSPAQLTAALNGLLRRAETGHPAPATATSSHPEAASRLRQMLTERQRDVLARVLQGHPSKVIAHDLGISQRTVESHRAAIMRALGARTLPDLVRRAIAVGGNAALTTPKATAAITVPRDRHGPAAMDWAAMAQDSAPQPHR